MLRARLSLTVLLSLFVFAGALPAEPKAQSRVTFRLDMQHEPMEKGAELLLRGGSATLGQWERDLVLTDENGDEVYRGSATFPDSMAGRKVEYKYLVRESGGAERWEERTNRTLTVPTSSRQLETVYFSDVPMGGVERPVTIVFEVDLSARPGPTPKAVALYGGREPLNWNLKQPALQLSGQDQIWQGEVTFPKGTLPDVPFRLAYRTKGKWEWEDLSMHVNHVLWLGNVRNGRGTQRSRLQTARLRFDRERGRLVHDAERNRQGESRIDQHGFVIQHLRAKGRSSDPAFINYHYEAALQLLEEGKMKKAERMHRRYEEMLPNPRKIDDYPFRKAKKIAEEKGLEQARAYCHQKMKDEPLQGRKAQFAYVDGEMLMKAGKPEKARAVFQKVLSKHEDLGEFGGEFLHYARYGLAVSHLATARKDRGRPSVGASRARSRGTGASPTDSARIESMQAGGRRKGAADLRNSAADSRRRGIEMLEKWSREEKTPQRWKRSALETLTSTYDRMDRHNEAVQTAGRLAQMGTPAQRVEARLRKQELNLERGRAKAAMRALDTLKTEARGAQGQGAAMAPRHQAELMRLKGRARQQRGQRGRGKKMLEEVRKKYPETPAARRAEHALKRARANGPGQGGSPRGGGARGGDAQDENAKNGGRNAREGRVENGNAGNQSGNGRRGNGARENGGRGNSGPPR